MSPNTEAQSQVRVHVYRAYPDHAEVQLGLLSTLQDVLEAGLALYRSRIRCCSAVNTDRRFIWDRDKELRADSGRRDWAAPLCPCIHSGGERGRHADHSKTSMFLDPRTFDRSHRVSVYLAHRGEMWLEGKAAQTTPRADCAWLQSTWTHYGEKQASKRAGTSG
ncbi:hypothetical protein EYF80_028751 [Liparis tanakae]|uniref:Uncharacterized protein n=1 Tax=Liparis tanakae TaxID=230148 RepID=A0A4Z2H7J3_9TELE|nr:hypothetical protein EYF80_028751 [Liparis tanakae]